MKLRKQINYEDIVEIGLGLIKEETDTLYGESEKNKAESSMRICGIVDFLSTIDRATQMTEEDKKTLEKSLVDNLKGDAVWHNYMTPCAIPSEEK